MSNFCVEDYTTSVRVSGNAKAVLDRQEAAAAGRWTWAEWWMRYGSPCPADTYEEITPGVYVGQTSGHILPPPNTLVVGRAWGRVGMVILGQGGLIVRPEDWAAVAAAVMDGPVGAEERWTTLQRAAAEAEQKRQEQERRQKEAQFAKQNQRRKGRWCVYYDGWINGQGDDRGCVGDGIKQASSRLVSIHDTREAAEAECRRLRAADKRRSNGDPSETWCDYRFGPYRVSDYVAECDGISHWSEAEQHEALMREIA